VLKEKHKASPVCFDRAPRVSFNQINKVFSILVLREAVGAAIGEFGYASDAAGVDINGGQRQIVKLECDKQFLVFEKTMS